MMDHLFLRGVPAIIFLLMFVNVCYGQSGKLTVEVSNIDVKKGGNISVGIFKKENFPKTGKQLVQQIKPANSNSIQIEFSQVPVGEYAVAVFQDIDNDKKLKINFIGYPAEPFGFSNDAPVKFGPPSFDEAKIKMETNQNLKIKIKLR